MVTICGEAENLEIEDGVRGDVCTLKAVANEFKFANVRSYSGRRHGAAEDLFDFVLSRADHGCLVMSGG